MGRPPIAFSSKRPAPHPMSSSGTGRACPHQPRKPFSSAFTSLPCYAQSGKDVRAGQTKTPPTSVGGAAIPYLLWQLLPLPQPGQPEQPPLFFSRTRLRARKNRTAARTINTRIVATGFPRFLKIWECSLPQYRGREHALYEVWRGNYLPVYLTSISSLSLYGRTIR